MIVSCDQCGVKLKVDESKIKPGGSKLRCPKCQSIFAVYHPDEQKPAAAAPPPVQAPPAPPRQAAPPVQAPPPPRPAVQAPPPPPPAPAPLRPPAAKWQLDRRKVVVADSGETTLSLIKGLLTQAGFETITASDGVQAMIEIEKNRPGVVILDVALPSIFGFEICDRLKNNPESSDVKIILIASIFDKTKYKREPTSLYGADDYIEKHHIQDFIAKKVNRLLSPVTSTHREEESFVTPPPSEAQVRERQAEQMRKEEIKDFPVQAPVDAQQVEAARRFARIILSDIALYNQGAVEQGIKGDNFQKVLSEEIKEGRELYNSRVPVEVRNSMDYFADELDKFVEKKKRLMEMS
jgi:predicted Zn finger-like uncharacterized protein